MKRYVSAAARNLTKDEREQLARRTSNARVLSILALDNDYDVRAATINNPYATKNVLKLALDNNGEMVRAIVEHPNCDGALMKYIISRYDLRNNINSAILYGILDRSKDPEVFEMLASSDLYPVRKAVANCDNTPKSVIEQLVYDPNEEIRAAIADRDDVDPEVLEILYYDPEPNVRRKVLTNSNFPVKLVMKYLDERDYSEEYFYGDQYALADILNRPDLPPDAANIVIGKIPSSVLADKGYLCDRLAEKPGLSTASMCKLIDAGDWGTVRELLKNPACNSDVVAYMSDKLKQGEIELYPDEIIKLLTRTTDAELLEMYSTKGSPREIPLAIIQNPNTPVEVLTKMAAGRDNKVKGAASRALMARQPYSNRIAEKSTSAKNSTTWETSPYEWESYANVADELDDVIEKAMKAASKSLGTKLSYQFDSADYDNAQVVTVTTDTGRTFTMDAQTFLVYVTSDVSKNVSSKRAAEYVVKSAGALQS